MTGSITASTRIVFPFLVALMGILMIPVRTVNGDAVGTSNYAEASFFLLGQAATAGAMLLLISTAPNLVAKAVDWNIVMLFGRGLVLGLSMQGAALRAG